MRDRRTRDEFMQVMVLEAYVLLALAPIVFAGVFGRLDHPLPAIAAGLIGLSVIALVFRRPGSWWTLLVLDLVIVTSYVWNWKGVMPFTLNVTALALLISAPMRRYVGARVHTEPAPQP